MLTALAATLLLPPAPVEPPAATPKGPPPRLVVIQPDRSGGLVSYTTRTQYVLETRRIMRAIGPRVVGENITVRVPVMTTVAEAWDLSKATIAEAGGKKVDAQELRQRVTSPTVVVVSADGKPVDKEYLKLFDRQTVVLVVPIPRRDAQPVPPGRFDVVPPPKK